MLLKVALISQSPCFLILSAGIKGMHCHTSYILDFNLELSIDFGKTRRMTCLPVQCVLPFVLPPMPLFLVLPKKCNATKAWPFFLSKNSARTFTD